MNSGLAPFNNKSALTERDPSQTLAIRRSQQASAGFVPHLGIDEVRLLAEAAERSGKGKNRERDRLLIETIFDGCFRVSEALGLRPLDLIHTEHGWKVRIVGKGNKPGEAAISPSLVARLQSYAYRNAVAPEARFFGITPARTWQIVDRAFQLAGILKPAHVGTVHVLRHSGALARLDATGNPKAVQDQLRHADAKMTLRYLKTLAAQESLRIQQGVDFGW